MAGKEHNSRIALEMVPVGNPGNARSERSGACTYTVLRAFRIGTARGQQPRQPPMRRLVTLSPHFLH
jgi:hypothetical protein